jgi:hypothetical protein
VAASPELYPTFVSLGAVKSLLGLLAHDNTDISLTVIALLVELTDTETAEEVGGWGGGWVGRRTKRRLLHCVTDARLRATTLYLPSLRVLTPYSSTARPPSH